MVLKNEMRKMKKPELTKDMSLQEFHEAGGVPAVLKELQKFWGVLGIPATGIKADLKNRISTYLEKGIVVQPEKKPQTVNDSDQKITRDTKVVNYKNDLITRTFFEKEVDNNFTFKVFLQDYIKKQQKKMFLSHMENLPIGLLLKQHAGKIQNLKQQ